MRLEYSHASCLSSLSCLVYCAERNFIAACVDSCAAVCVLVCAAVGILCIVCMACCVQIYRGNCLFLCGIVRIFERCATARFVLWIVVYVNSDDVYFRCMLNCVRSYGYLGEIADECAVRTCWRMRMR